MQFRLVHTGRVGGGVGSTNMYHKLYSPDHVMNKIFQSSTTKKKKKKTSHFDPCQCRGLMWKKEFDTSYVGFMKDGAKWLVDNTDIKLVGERTVTPVHFEVKFIFF